MINYDRIIFVMTDGTVLNKENTQKVLDSLKQMFGANAEIYELADVGSDGSVKVRFKLKVSDQFLVGGKPVSTEELAKEQLAKLLKSRLKGCVKVEFV